MVGSTGINAISASNYVEVKVEAELGNYDNIQTEMNLHSLATCLRLYQFCLFIVSIILMLKL